MTTSSIRARRHRVFRSVFQVDVAEPTPSLPSVAPGEAFGGPLVPSNPIVADGDDLTSPGRRQHLRRSSAKHVQSQTSQTRSPSAAAKQVPGDQVRWDRAWHAVTTRILLPTSVAVEDSFGTLGPESQELDPGFHDALALVLNPAAAVPRASHTDDILQWHAQQVRQHFVHHVLPLLAACASQGAPAQVLLSSIHTLEAAHRQYLYGLSLILRGINDDAAAAAALAGFRRDLHAIIGNSWTRGLVESLRRTLRRRVNVVLGAAGRETGAESPPATADGRASAARDELLGLVGSLKTVGLAGERFQVLFAEVMDVCMETHIHDMYAGNWDGLDRHSRSAASGLSRCMSDLSDWIENHYSRLAVEVFSRIGGQVSWTDVERWKDIATGRLATLRIHELFDIVLRWPDSKGGLEDLRSAVTTPQRRLQLTDIFSATLQRRLLHPGRSTLDILKTYISMIRTFHALDHSKVLLDRVVHALQLYICQRDDAIRIVVTGLLSSPGSVRVDDRKGRLVELAEILNEASQQQRRYADEEDLGWSDMTWVPDPVDAGVNYKRPKDEDVVGTIISALGSQDIFIKEFQLIISERLLSNQSSFHQETKVLSLLKKRFGDAALQNCDVMMKDIQDSKRVDAVIGKTIRRDMGEDFEVPSYHSKILSRLFWPSLPKDPFAVPPPIAAVQEQYEAGFEQLKSSRKLAWLDHLGSAAVKLDLEDRTVEVECKTYEAAVIYAFQDDDDSAPQPLQRSFNDLWEHLRIDEDLLDQALRFWVSKRVLRDIGSQTYMVLERLDDDGGTEGAEDATLAQNGAESGQTLGSPRKPKNLDTEEGERRAVYWQFIVGMLTNSSPSMPLGQILMMMKMLIADGCSWSNEELQEFLGEKMASGELELVGGKYRLPKK